MPTQLQLLSQLDPIEIVAKSFGDDVDWSSILWLPALPHIFLSYEENSKGVPATPASYLCTAAPTAFQMDQIQCSSLESFYNALKFPEGSTERLLCAQASANDAHEMTARMRGTTFQYDKSEITVGSKEHAALIARAVCAKVDQNPIVSSTLARSCWHKLRFSLLPEKRVLVLGAVTCLALMLKRWKLFGPIPEATMVSEGEAFRNLLYFDMALDTSAGAA